MTKSASTPRIRLVCVTQAHKQALQQGRDVLASLLSLPVPDGWPEFPEAFVPAIDGTNSTGPWSGYFFVADARATLVGNGGFTGPPDADGTVEIGYEIAPAFRNRGYATAAARALLEIAFEHPSVRKVVAHTLAESNASNSVLKKVGMTFCGELPNDEVGRVWRWELSRTQPGEAV